jgi:hypothetical protein
MEKRSVGAPREDHPRGFVEIKDDHIQACFRVSLGARCVRCMFVFIARLCCAQTVSLLTFVALSILLIYSYEAYEASFLDLLEKFNRLLLHDDNSPEASQKKQLYQRMMARMALMVKLLLLN